jgi:RNA recognition motif-containing protein
MVKTLFCGEVVDATWPVLVNRLEELQRSQHGPFEILFLTTPFSVSEEVLQLHSDRLAQLDMKIYAFASPSLSSAQSPLPHSTLPSCLELFRDGLGIINAHKNLTVAYFFQTLATPAATATDAQPQSGRWAAVEALVQGSGYRGCDVLVSDRWPRGAQYFLSPTDDADLLRLLPAGLGSSAAADVAQLVRPRYFFASDRLLAPDNDSGGLFLQRRPYANPATLDRPALFTRLLSVAPVTVADSTNSANKDKEREKQRKWLHALSLTPILYMKRSELEEAPADSTACPFPLMRSLSSSTAHTVRPRADRDGPGDDDPLAKRFKHVEETEQSGQSFFFQNNTSGGTGGTARLSLVPPSLDARTLFVGGLGRDWREQDLQQLLLQHVPQLRQAPQNTVKAVRRIPGKAFAFVEFSDHDSARRVVEVASRGHGLVLHQRRINVGWSDNANTNTNAPGSAANGTTVNSRFDVEAAMRDRQLVPPAEDARTLFVGNVPVSATPDVLTGTLRSLFPVTTTVEFTVQLPPSHRHATSSTHYVFVDCDSYATAMAIVTRSLQETILCEGQPLVIGWSMGSQYHHLQQQQQQQQLSLPPPPSRDCKVLFLGGIAAETTTHDVEALVASTANAASEVVAVRRPEGRDYAFVEFTKPAAAVACGETLVDSQATLRGVRVRVGWARGKPADQANQSADCWFCLASPSIKVGTNHRFPCC